ncbi:MAG: BMC domain-containing protein [Desulfobacteraceae bacterium]|nr:BMC domain-containing protein [Desulfobacteraceae bacterium]
MDGKALGLVETLGLVPAIEGADAAVKSADVELKGVEMIGAGLVTIKIVGDISAVSSAVDAGKAAAARLGTVRSTTVIGRTGEGLETVLEPEPAPEPDSGKPAPAPVAPNAETVIGEAPEAAADPVNGKVLELVADPETGKVPEATADALTVKVPGKTVVESIIRKTPDKKTVDRAALKNMSVVKLRQFARKLPGLPLAQKKIKYARKKELIEAIVEYHRNKEE